MTAGLVLGAALFTTTSAFAGQPVPQPDDGRAVVSGYPMNAVTCDQVSVPGAKQGLTGQTVTGDSIDQYGITASISQGTYITITGLPKGFTLTGVVVKGSDAYNVYLPGQLGSLPWTNLHSPTAGNSGAPAAISHWFLCGTGAVVASGGSSAPPSDAAKPGTSSVMGHMTGHIVSGTTGSTGGTPAGEGESANTAAGGGASSAAGLANTGVDAFPVLLLGGLLLTGGVGLLAVRRIRTRPSDSV
jgi:LPXTG-motif cell wall-anchored protein